jgi:antitoxin (DNA-binding transcriptional repressor) of toxin-antitoxin stability system
MSIVITEEQMPIARLIALRTGVKLEGKAKGMKMTRGRSCMARVKSEFGWSGNRETIIQKLSDAIVKKLGFDPANVEFVDGE